MAEGAVGPHPCMPCFLAEPFMVIRGALLRFAEAFPHALLTFSPESPDVLGCCRFFISYRLLPAIQGQGEATCPGGASPLACSAPTALSVQLLAHHLSHGARGCGCGGPHDQPLERLEIERARFQERLALDLQIDPEALDALV